MSGHYYREGYNEAKEIDKVEAGFADRLAKLEVVRDKADQLVTNVMAHMQLGAEEAMEYGFDDLDEALSACKATSHKAG